MIYFLYYLTEKIATNEKTKTFKVWEYTRALRYSFSVASKDARWVLPSLDGMMSRLDMTTLRPDNAMPSCAFVLLSRRKTKKLRTYLVTVWRQDNTWNIMSQDETNLSRHQDLLVTLSFFEKNKKQKNFFLTTAVSAASCKLLSLSWTVTSTSPTS